MGKDYLIKIQNIGTVQFLWALWKYIFILRRRMVDNSK